MAGFGFIDTADVYSVWVPGHDGGESEKVIGNWLAARGNRDKAGHRHQGGHVAENAGAESRQYHRRLRRVAEAAEDRLYRSLSEPSR